MFVVCQNYMKLRRFYKVKICNFCKITVVHHNSNKLVIMPHLSVEKRVNVD